MVADFTPVKSIVSILRKTVEPVLPVRIVANVVNIVER